MKVLHLVHSFHTGGAEKVVLDLVQRARADIRNVVCSFTEPGGLAAELDTEREKFCCLGKRDGNDPTIVPKLRRLINDERIDLVHAQGWGTYLEGLIAAKLFSARRPAFVFAFHGKSLDELAAGVPWRRRFAQRVAYAFTDACIAPAAQMARDYSLSIGVPSDGVRVIHNGVDARRFSGSARSSARAMLGLTEADFVVGFAGRFDPIKDIEGAVEAFARFRSCVAEKQRDGVKLLLVGDGEERDSIRSAVSGCGLAGAVILAGMRPDVPQCMSAMDVYFQPSLYEGHSLTLLEAMASALPVISTRVGGTPEIVADGRTGFLLEPRDYEGMGRRLADLFSDLALRKRVGAAARERVVDSFSVAAMVASYERLFDDLVPGEKRACAA